VARRLWLVAAALVAGALIATLVASGALVQPAPAEIGNAPPDLGAQSIAIGNPGRAPVAGWLVRGSKGAGVILLLHGVRSDRRQMIGRARFLHRLRYSVLMIDLPAHGETPGDHITFGASESTAVTAAFSYLASEFPGEPTAVIGVSLGAASVVLARPPLAPNAAVLESMYPTIEEAVIDRIRLHAGDWAVPFAPVLLAQMPWRIGVSGADLRPIDALRSIKSPVLIAGGSADMHTTGGETRRIFEAANAPKDLWIVEGAAHEDLHRFAPAAYEERIGAFLARYMRGGTGVAPSRSNGAK
jgi:uncharacterized protein